MAEEKALVEKPETQVVISGGNSLFFDVAIFEHAQRVAKVFAASTMVPDHFRGNIGNCLIAMDYAARIRANPFMVMQNMYIVHGKPGIEGKLVIALVNQSGRFEPLEFEETEDGCRAFAKEKKSDKVLYGPWVTWKIVKSEGWYDKNGSKWKTMPELMFRYRSATFFARTYCPEVMLGMMTTDEIEDIIDTRKVGKVFEAAKQESAPVEKPVKYKAEDLSPAGDDDPQAEYKTEPPPQEVPSFRDEYVNLRSKGFKKWVNDNLKRIYDNTSEEDQQEIREKWYRMYPNETYPLDPDPINPEDEPGYIPPAPVTDEDDPTTVGNGNAIIHCPVKGSRVSTQVCAEKCDKAETCQVYQEWKFENAV